MTIYNMLTRTFPYPFRKERERDPVDVILNDDIVPIRARDKTLPKNLCAVLDNILEKKAKGRYQTAAEILAAIRQAAR